MNRTLIIGVVGIVIVLIALGLNYWLTPGEEPMQSTVAGAPELAPSEPKLTIQTAPKPSSAPAPASETAGETAASQEPPSSLPLEPQQSDAPPQQARTDPGQPAPAAPALTTESPDAGEPSAARPQFDVVRVTPTGDIVVAGRAEPGAVVTVYDDGRPIGQIMADSRGEWVMLPDEPLPPGSRELSLSSRLGDAEPLWSDNVVVIVVPEAGLDVAGRPAQESSGPLVVEVPRTGFGTTDVLQQPPADESGTPKKGPDIALSVDVLDYDERGNLGLSGNANAESSVLVYLDNELLAAAPAGPGGAWRLIVKRRVEPGIYTMRIDEMAGDKVVARLEFPFQRVDPSEVETGTLLVVVQPGNSLWRLARRTLGEGTQYTVIYQANRDRIRDPDLIYPGQVFVIPRTN